MTIDITNIPEQTISVGAEAVEVVGVLSFQNISPTTVYWSTQPFGSTNRGAIVSPYTDIIFSTPTTVYFRRSESDICNGVIHTRSISL